MTADFDPNLDSVSQTKFPFQIKGNDLAVDLCSHVPTKRRGYWVLVAHQIQPQVTVQVSRSKIAIKDLFYQISIFDGNSIFALPVNDR